MQREEEINLGNDQAEVFNDVGPYSDDPDFDLLHSDQLEPLLEKVRDETYRIIHKTEQMPKPWLQLLADQVEHLLHIIEVTRIAQNNLSSDGQEDNSDTDDTEILSSSAGDDHIGDTEDDDDEVVFPFEPNLLHPATGDLRSTRSC